jgi:hypothetical protein
MYSRGTNNLNANQFRDDRLNVYNLNTRTATSYPVNDEIQDQNTSYLNNSNLNYSNNNTSNYVNDAYNVSSVDNQIYFEKPRTDQNVDENEIDEVFDHNESNRLRVLDQQLVDDNESQQEDEEEQEPNNDDDENVSNISEYYFQTKLRNSGFWGKVSLRRGTWLFIVGLLLLPIALTLISVFWHFWYGPAVNIPLRSVGIALLCVSVVCTVSGLVSNFFMYKDPVYKAFIGSPVHPFSWILLISIIAITIASILITIYYTYWHNRFVNTPLIVIALTFYFFGGIAFFISLFKNYQRLNTAYVQKYGPIKKDEKSEGKAKVENEKESDHLQKEEQSVQKTENEIKTSIVDENQSSLDESTNKRGFRKKLLKIKPRTELKFQSESMPRTIKEEKEQEED